VFGLARRVSIGNKVAWKITWVHSKRREEVRLRSTSVTKERSKTAIRNVCGTSRKLLLSSCGSIGIVVFPKGRIVFLLAPFFDMGPSQVVVGPHGRDSWVGALLRRFEWNPLEGFLLPSYPMRKGRIRGLESKRVEG